MSNKNILDSLRNIKPNYIHAYSLALALFIAVAVPSFPTTVHPEVQAFYNYMEAIPPGSVFVMDSSSQSVSTEMSVFLALAKWIHIWKLPLKVIVVSTHGAAGPLNVASVMRIMPEQYKKLKTYGVDWVWLGYNPGFETNIAAFASDIRKTYPVDVYGTPLDQIPMMATGNPKTGGPINSAWDFYALNFDTSNQEIMAAYVRIFGEIYNVPIVREIGTTAWASCGPYIPRYMPVWFFSSWVVEYEALLGFKGLNMMTYSADVFFSMSLVGIVLIQNLAWYLNRRKMKLEGKVVPKWM